MSLMSTKPYTVASPSGDPVVIGKPQLGYTPSEVNAGYLIRADGLDGGTFTVNLYTDGAAAPWEFQAGVADSGAVWVNGPSFNAAQVVFAGLGAGASPVVYFSGQARS